MLQMQVRFVCLRLGGGDVVPEDWQGMRRQVSSSSSTGGQLGIVWESD